MGKMGLKILNGIAEAIKQGGNPASNDAGRGSGLLGSRDGALSGARDVASDIDENKAALDATNTHLATIEKYRSAHPELAEALDGINNGRQYFKDTDASKQEAQRSIGAANKVNSLIKQ